MLLTLYLDCTILTAEVEHRRRYATHIKFIKKEVIKMKRSSFKFKYSIDIPLNTVPVPYNVRLVPYKSEPTQCAKPALTKLAECLKALDSETNK